MCCTQTRNLEFDFSTNICALSFVLYSCLPSQSLPLNLHTVPAGCRNNTKVQSMCRTERSTATNVSKSQTLKYFFHSASHFTDNRTATHRSEALPPPWLKSGAGLPVLVLPPPWLHSWVPPRGPDTPGGRYPVFIWESEPRQERGCRHCWLCVTGGQREGGRALLPTVCVD